MEWEMLTKPNLRVVEPTNIYRKVPTRKPNAEMRTREYLTPDEVEKLIAAAKLGRHGQRDATLILVAFRRLAGGRDRRSGVVAA
jgi:type 1 fimbriae regulatory protein FimB/type 1 fimbriae regulatory protein FimE